MKLSKIALASLSLLGALTFSQVAAFAADTTPAPTEIAKAVVKKAHYVKKHHHHHHHHHAKKHLAKKA